MKSDRSKRDRFQRHKGRLVNNDTHYTATSPSQLADRKRAVEEREGGRQKYSFLKKMNIKTGSCLIKRFGTLKNTANI